VLAGESDGLAQLGPEAERVLMGYAWPGNVRQLRHVLRTAAALADGRPIAVEHLPSLAALASGHAPAARVAAPAVEEVAPPEAEAPIKLNPIQANERHVLLQMLEQHRWNVSNVAKALDVSRNTLYRKLHKLHIEISHAE